MSFDASSRLRSFRLLKYPSASVCLLTVCLLGASGARADTMLVENPGPIVIMFTVAEISYGPSSGPRPASFYFDSTRPEACRDGLNNDDRRQIGLGLQDTAIDHPADPDCSGPEDDSEDKPGLQPRQTMSLTGTIDSEGVFHIPAAGILIPPQYMQSDRGGLGGDRVVINTFEPTHDAVGRLDPFTGEMTLRLRYRVRIRVDGSGRFSGPGEHCYLGSESEPHDIVLRTGTGITSVSTQGVGGQPYSWHDGSFSVTGTNVATVPGATCCGFFCFGDSQISASFGVPAERGTMTLLATGRISPAPIPAVRAIHVRAPANDGNDGVASARHTAAVETSGAGSSSAGEASIDALAVSGFSSPGRVFNLSSID